MEYQNIFIDPDAYFSSVEVYKKFIEDYFKWKYPNKNVEEATIFDIATDLAMNDLQIKELYKTQENEEARKRK